MPKKRTDYKLKPHKELKAHQVPPREAWVLEQPDYFVFRYPLSREFHAEYGARWWESSPVNREMANVFAQEKLGGKYPKHLCYAVRYNPETNEKLLALVRPQQLLGQEPWLPADLDLDQESVRTNILHIAFSILDGQYNASTLDQAKAIADAVTNFLDRTRQERETKRGH